MSENKANQEVPPSLKIIAMVAIAWNSFGLLEFYMRVSMASGGLSTRSAEEQLFFENFPTWANMTLAIAALTGVAGSFFLLIRKTWAYPMFIISLITMASLNFYLYLATDFLKLLGPSSVFYDLLAIAVSLFLVVYSKKAKKEGWLS